MTNPATFP
jgi:hypothetical protein